MERLYSLQGIRGAAVLAVVLFHMAAVELKYSGGVHILPAMAISFQLGVDLFFGISGFVMVIVTRGRFQSWVEGQRFLFNRLSRIYPTYWLYFFITLAIYLAQPGLVNASHGESNLLMSFALLPNDKVLLVMVAWSLVFELWFYLVFSGFLLFAQRYLPCLLLLWAGVIIVFNRFADWHDYSSALKIMLHPYALEFIVGALVGVFFYSRHSTRLPDGLVWGGLAGSLLLGFPLIGLFHLYDGEGLPRMLGVAAVFSSLTLSLALLERRQLIRVPGFLVQIGDMSYTIYLSHLLVLGVIGRVWQWVGAGSNTDLLNAFFLVLMMTAVLGYGWVGYRFFEKPVLDRAMAYCKRRFRKPAVLGSTTSA